MATFIVTYTHPDETGWNEHLAPHLEWIVEHLEAGHIRASGPLVGIAVRSAALIIEADDRPHLDAIIASDPLSIHGLVEEMTVVEWDPIFGALAK